MIKIERITDLFDDDIVEEMLSVVEELHACYWNSATICRIFREWDCINYVEGYLSVSDDHNSDIGHAINTYIDYNGVKHYFDITQEYNIKNGLVKKFNNNFEVVKEYDANEIIEIFNNEGVAHLINVETIRIYENFKEEN